MSRYLSRLGRFSFVHRRAVLAAWLLVLGLAIVLAAAGGGKTSDTFSVPGTQSQQAVDLLQQRIPAFAGASTQIIVATHPGEKVTDPAVAKGIDAAVAKLGHVPQVAAVANPFQAKSVSPNGRAALITVQYAAQAPEVKTATLNDLSAAVGPARATGAEVEFSGAVYPGSAIKPSEVPELVGILIGFVILLITFGVIAAGLPLLTAIIGVAIAAAAVERGTGLSARVVTAAALIMFAVFAAFMIGGNSTIKAIGFSLAAGVLFDAFVVRLTLVPAVMSLAGGRIWYHPCSFARRVPDLDIEGASLELEAPAPDLTPSA